MAVAWKRPRFTLRNLLLLVTLAAVVVWFAAPFPMQLVWTPTGRPPKMGDNGAFYFTSFELTNRSRGTIYFRSWNSVTVAYSQNGQVVWNSEDLQEDLEFASLRPGESIEIGVQAPTNADHFWMTVGARRWNWDSYFGKVASPKFELRKSDTGLFIGRLAEP